MRTSTIPSKDQIIQLHGLTQEAKILGRKINFSLNTLLSNLICSVSIDYLFGYLVSNYGKHIENTESSTQWAYLLGTLGLVYGSAHTLYQGVAAVTSYFLPYGIGISSSGIEDKNINLLLTSENSQKLLSQFKKLTETQRSLNKAIKFINWASTVFLPFLSLCSFNSQENTVQTVIETSEILLGLGTFGPYIYLSNFKSKVPPFIFELITSQQALHNLSYIYNKWDNYNLPAQIQTFQRRLNHLSYSNKGWEIQNSAAEKAGIVLSFVISEPTLQFIDEHKISRTITTAFYMEILHRILTHIGITGYALSERILYAGMSELSQKMAARSKAALLRQLITVSELEELGRINLKRLNKKVNIAVGVYNNAWQSHFEFDNKTHQYQLFYFIRKQTIPHDIRSEYLDFLNKILPQKNIIQDGDLIKLTEMPKTISHFNVHLQSLSKAYEYKIAEDKPVNRTNTKLDKRLRTIPRKKVTVDDKKPIAEDLVLPELPSTLTFKAGYHFFFPQPKLKPEKYAYPILLPWLSPGSAFVCIDVAVFAKVKAFVGKGAILAQLERGALHSTKEGFGIQTKIQRYKACDGKLYTSSLQMKFNNNIGIFAYKFQAIQAGNKRYELHQFNGPGFRH